MSISIRKNFSIYMKLLFLIGAALVIALITAQPARAEVSNKLMVSVADWKETGVAIKNPAKGPALRSTQQEEEEKKEYTEDDLWCLSAVIYQEAGGDACSDLCRKLVGSVVLNRAEDTVYFGSANTIRDVLETKGQYGMEDGVKWADRGDSERELAAKERACEAAKAVLEGDRPCPKNVFFQSEFDFLGDGIYMELDGYYFNYIS